MEDQAFGRVHRIGQTKKTYFVKIVTRNTVDQRLISLQDEKLKNISKVLEGTASTLSIDDIKRLFGDNEEGESDAGEAEGDNRAEAFQD